MFGSFGKSLRDLDAARVLELAGLERRRSMAERLLPVAALFSTGVLLGVALVKNANERAFGMNALAFGLLVMGLGAPLYFVSRGRFPAAP